MSGRANSLTSWPLLLCAVVVSMMLPRPLDGATITANSANFSDVQAAIDSANHGDTVLVPAGSVIWNSKLTVTKGITLQGAGMGQTVITGSDNILTLDTARGLSYRLTGFEFRASGGTYWSGRIRVRGNSYAVRIDNCRFYRMPQWQLRFYGNVRGVVDSCRFDLVDGAVNVEHNNWKNEVEPSSSNGDYSWADDAHFGTDQFVFLEDNVFVGTANDQPVIDSVAGARWVFRYNKMTNCIMRSHGTDSTRRSRSTRAIEIYKNTCVVTGSSSWSELLEVRGGTGLIFSNTVVNFNRGANLKYFREQKSSWDPWGVWPDPNWDVSGGYPALDQPGRGKGDYLSGGSDSSPPSPSGWPNQAPEPWYSWDNTFDGVPDDGVTKHGDINVTIASGRDYHNASSFSDAVSKGMASSYSPYIYPHPLRTGEVTPPDNRAPVALDQSVTLSVDTARVITLVGSDPDGDNLTYTVVNSPAKGSLSGTPPILTYTPNNGFTGNDSFTFKVNDGEFDSGDATISINVTSGSGLIPGTDIYYVDKDHPNAADVSSNGGEDTPWASVGYAVSRISGGATIVVKESVTPYDLNEGFTVLGPSGTEAQPTTLMAYPGHKPELRGRGNSGRIKLDGVSHWVIDGLDIANLNHIIMIQGASHHITVKNCSLHDSGAELLRIKGNSHDILLENNVMLDGGSIASGNGEAFYVGEHQGSDYCYNVVIRSNYIANMEHEAIELKPDTHDCIVEYNTITNCVYNYEYGKWSITLFPTLTYGTSPNHIVRGNVIQSVAPYGTGAGIKVDTGAYVYNNVIYNVTSPAYAIEVDADNDPFTPHVWNNTLDVPASRAINVKGGTPSIGNNIGPSSGGNMEFNSLYFIDAPGRDYHLLPGAAPVDSGSTPPFSLAFDMDGIARVAPVDLGAYELNTGQPLPPILAASPGNLDFGSVASGTSRDLPVTVRNVGGGTLEGTATVGAPFSIVGGGSYSLTNGESHVVTVRYAPATPGSDSASLQLTGGQGASVAVAGAATGILAGLSWEPEQAILTAPFTLSGGSISQSVATFNGEGGQASYTFNLSAPGDYVLVASVNAPAASANSLFINIDGQPVSPDMTWDIDLTSGFADRTVSWRGSGTDAANEFSPKVFSLSAGVHELIVRGREAGVQLGRVTLVPAETRPTPPSNLRILAQVK